MELSLKGGYTSYLATPGNALSMHFFMNSSKSITRESAKFPIYFHAGVQS